MNWSESSLKEEELERTLRKAARKSNGELDKALLMHYIEIYSARFISDNQGIWNVGSIMIPVSFSAFAVLASLEDIKVWHVVLLGAASVLVYRYWLVVASNLKAFQGSHEKRVNIALKILEIDDGIPSKYRDRTKIAQQLTQRGKIRDYREGVYKLLKRAWIVIFLCTLVINAPEILANIRGILESLSTIGG